MLTCTSNLDKWRSNDPLDLGLCSPLDSLYYPEQKYDHIFDLRTDQGMILCNEKLEEIVDKLEGQVDKKVSSFFIFWFSDSYFRFLSSLTTPISSRMKSGPV